MTTRPAGITLPLYAKVRLSNSCVEVSSQSDFASNASYKFSSSGVLPLSAVAPVSAAPAGLAITTQNAAASFASTGAALRLELGVGSVGQASGNVEILNTAGVGGAYNTTHIVMGAYHLWWDSSGRLRSKASVPSSAEDGIVCGIDLSGSATYDPANLVDGAGVTTAVAVAGCLLGDLVLVSFSLDLQGIILTAYVSAAGTVSVRFQNETGGAVDLASGTLRVRVIKQ